MTLAVCIYCGEQKFGALNACDSCGKMPAGSEDIARSMILTDHYMSAENLEKAQRAVTERYPWYDIPNIKARIESFKRDSFTDSGEFDTARIMAAFSANTAGHDSGEVNTASASQHTGKRNEEDGGCSRKLGCQTEVVNAICIFCGAVKEDPLIECPSCQRQPKDLDAVARSIMLSSENFDAEMLVRLQEVVKLGIDWTMGQNTQERLHQWRVALSDRNGELDLMKVVHYKQFKAGQQTTTPEPQHESNQNKTNSLEPTSQDIQSNDEEELSSRDWAGWVKSIFSVLAFFAPTLGLFIGTYGMALRGNRRQCKSIWITSIVGVVLFGGYCCAGNAIVGNTVIAGLIAAGILLFGLMWTLTIYLSTRESMNTKVSAVVIAALILIGTLWVAASLCLSDDIWKTMERGRSTAAAPVVLTKYVPIPTPLVTPISVSNPSVVPIPTVDIQYTILGATRKEVVSYFNDFLPPATRLEQIAIDRWAQILSTNTPVDQAAIITEREIIPNWRIFMDYIQKKNPQNEDLRAYHQQFIRIADMRMAAYQTFVRGVHAQDDRIIRYSVQQLQRVDAEVANIQTRTLGLFKKYQIVAHPASSSTSNSVQ